MNHPFDGKMLVIGGKDHDWKDSDVCEILHVKQNEWSGAAPLPSPAVKPLSALVSGFIFILPQEPDQSGSFSRLLVYNIASDTHAYRAPVPSSVRSL